MLSPRLIHCPSFRGLAATLEDVISPSLQGNRRVRILLPNTAASDLFQVQLRARLGKQKALPRGTISSVQAFIEELVKNQSGQANQADAPRLADGLLREALLEQAFREVSVDTPPPFPLRAGLIRRVLAFYDRLTLNHPVAGNDADPPDDDGDILEVFERRALEVLDAPDDVGAERLAAQTRFLVTSLERYRSILATTEQTDPVGILRWIADARPRSKYSHLVILGADSARVAEVDALGRLSGLESFDVVSLAALSWNRWASRFWGEKPASEGYGSKTPRLEAAPLSWLQPDRPDPQATPGSTLEAETAFIARDREDSIQRVAKIIKSRAAAGALPALDRVAIVVPHPLPYLYVAKKVLEECAIPFRLHDTFPLAAEPWVSALDVVLEFCETGARREPTLALFRSPFFLFPTVSARSISAFASLTARYREVGGFQRWHRLWKKKNQPLSQPSLPGIDDRAEDAEVLRVLEVLLELEQTLAPILDPGGRLSAKLDALEQFAAQYGQESEAASEGHADSEPGPTRGEGDRRIARARGAVQEILTHWRWVVGKSSDPPMDAAEFRDRVHRALEQRTFALQSRVPRTPSIQIVDAQTAGFGDFDLVFLVGLNDAEWPRRHDRDVFYPQWFLREFGWPSDHELLMRERASFLGLVALAGAELAMIRHELEDDLPTIPSPFLDDAREWLSSHAAAKVVAGPLPIVSRNEALRRRRIEFAAPPRATTLAGRLNTKLRVPEPVSATSLETYLRCPFKYFARYLLGLEEEEAVDEGLNPLERGRLLHEILHVGFAEWDRNESTPRTVTVENFDEAVALFRQVAVEKLPALERREELNRLFGTGGRSGAIEWILRLELGRPGLRRRLVEHAFRTPIQLREGPNGESPWFVQVKGRVDRADIDREGRLHVYDYKSGRAPARATTLQVPLYAMCLSQELDAPIAEAAYLSLRDTETRRREDFEDASLKLKESMGGIQNGQFGPKPAQDNLCNFCGYVALCRKEIREEIRESGSNESRDSLNG